MFGAFKAYSLIGRFDRGRLGLTPIIGIILHWFPYSPDITSSGPVYEYRIVVSDTVYFTARQPTQNTSLYLQLQFFSDWIIISIVVVVVTVVAGLFIRRKNTVIAGLIILSNLRGNVKFQLFKRHYSKDLMESLWGMFGLK